MLKLISDQNFSGPVLRGIFPRVPDVDIFRTVDVGLDQASDPDVLAWPLRIGFKRYSLVPRCGIMA
jgi:hypothetical protein